MKKLHKAYQSLTVGMLLCAVGGSLDADSYLLHGHVFAGLQTGNLVLLGAGYSQLSTVKILKYVAALIAFVLGLIITRLGQDHYYDQANPRLKLSDLAVWCEIILLLTVALFSNVAPDWLLISLMSFVGAVQLQAFQLIEGNSFTPLMMMGHIKKVVNFLDQGQHRRVVTNVASLASFFVGAVITGLLTILIQDWALLFAVMMLFGILWYVKFN